MPLQDLPLPGRPEYYLAAGPELLNRLTSHPSQPLPHEEQGWPHNCVLLDVPARAMWVAATRFGVTDPRLAEEIAARWSGWNVHLHHDGILRHLELTGRDPTPLLRPLEDHIKSTAAEIMCGDRDADDSAAVTRALRYGIDDGVAANPSMNQPHRLGLSLADRMELFLKVLTEWRSRQGMACGREPE